jgi:hypothetical protein
MNYKEKAQAAAQEILTAFEEGTIRARMFIHRENDVPARRWSFSNRLLAALRGHNDARGFRQWKEVGRFVKVRRTFLQHPGPAHGKAKEDDEQGGSKPAIPSSSVSSRPPASKPEVLMPLHAVPPRARIWPHGQGQSVADQRGD